MTFEALTAVSIVRLTAHGLGWAVRRLPCIAMRVLSMHCWGADPGIAKARRVTVARQAATQRAMELQLPSFLAALAASSDAALSSRVRLRRCLLQCPQMTGVWQQCQGLDMAAPCCCAAMRISLAHSANALLCKLGVPRLLWRADLRADI